MRKVVVRKAIRGAAGAMALSAVVTLSICSYCYLNDRSFRAGAQEIDGEVAALWRLPVDDERGTVGNRMAVAFTAPDTGERVVVNTSGLYRAEEGATIGGPAKLWYNPSHPMRVALDSPWNWIGTWYYGMITALLLVGAAVLLRLARKLPVRPLPA
jgi:hypothetical protein